MEYKRAYYKEAVDENLVWRHKREIFPLLKLRHLFSQVDNFEFYDFINSNEVLNQNIFVYSNKSDYESALVIFNNSYNTWEGGIKHTSPKNQNGSLIPPKDIATVFYFNPGEKFYYIYTDHRTQLQFLVSGKEINDEGFKITLFGYQYRICLNFREVYDEAGAYAKLYGHLNGRGVVSIDDTLIELEMSPLHSALQEFLAPPNIRKIRDYLFHPDEKVSKAEKRVKESQISSSLSHELSVLISEVEKYNFSFPQLEEMDTSFNKSIKSCKAFYDLWRRQNRRKTVPKWLIEANTHLPLKIENTDNSAICLYLVFITINSVLSNGLSDAAFKYDKLLLEKPVTEIFNHHSIQKESRIYAELIKVLLIFYYEISDVRIKIKKKKKDGKNNAKKPRGALQKLPFSELLFDENVSSYLQANEYNNITYFNKERFEILIRWLYQLIIIQSYDYYEKELFNLKTKKQKTTKPKKQVTKQDLDRELINTVKNSFLSAKKIMWLAEEAGYDLMKFSNAMIRINKKSRINVKDGINET
jgi:hypothetical protein